MIEINRSLPESQEEIALYDLVTEYTGKYYNFAKRTNNQILMLLVMLYQRIVSSSSFALLDAMKRRQAFLQNEANRLNSDSVTEFNDEDLEIEALLKQIAFKNRHEIEIELQFVSACIEKAEKLTLTHQDVKFRKLLEVIDEIKSREHKPTLKFLIFTEFRATQDAIIEFLSQFGYSCCFIHGGLSREEKVEQVEHFRTTHQIMVSTDAGGEGINLQFCYCLINFDLPWNPSRLEQRIGRVDRIGQQNETLIFNFHLTDTIEDRVRQILEQKLEKIKLQFGEDKYSDVLNLLQDEFSFDRIYIEAIRIKEVENKELDALADQIFRRAKAILENDDLLLPFSQFSQDARELVNNELNTILKNLVIQYFRYRNLALNWYKEDKDFCYFNNPFPLKSDEPVVYRNVTFENIPSLRKEKVEFINLEHPLIKNIQDALANDEQQGKVSAFRIAINKFQGIGGFWFIYQLTIKNHLDRHKTVAVNIFMEDDQFENSRISHFLDQNLIDDTQIIQNFQMFVNIESITKTALKCAELKANEIFTATKMVWVHEIDAYQNKFEDYFRFKENAFKKIQIDNIRESKLKTLEKEKLEQAQKFQLQRNIVPTLELYQAAFVEFI